jgi:steroid delta-isomerase-like uncharacterized protein
MPKGRQVAAEAVEAFNAHDERWLRALYDDAVVLEVPGEGRLEGADAAIDYTRRWLRAFPDAGAFVDQEIAEGDWIAHRLVVEGTHQDAFVGRTDEIPATHRPLRLDAVALTRIRDGKIKHQQLFFDQSELLVQLGLVGELAISS